MANFAAIPVEILDWYLPGYGKMVADMGLGETETVGNPAIDLFRTSGGCGLLVPEAYGGAGLSAVHAVEVQTGIGYFSPSTAVALTMHQFTMATISELVAGSDGLEWMFLDLVAKGNMLVASGFAEGDPAGKVLRPSMRLEANGDDYVLTGKKHPCSLAKSMDIITVSVLMPDSENIGVAVLPVPCEGLTVTDFWESSILGGAETCTVTFDNVAVSRDAVSSSEEADALDAAQVRGYVWFQALTTASYLGAAMSFTEKVAGLGRFNESQLVEVASELAMARSALLHCAERLDAGDGGPELLSKSLLVRFGIERSIQRATDVGFERLGVGELSTSDDALLLFASSRALAYHPPSRQRSESLLRAYLEGEDLHEQLDV